MFWFLIELAFPGPFSPQCGEKARMWGPQGQAARLQLHISPLHPCPLPGGGERESAEGSRRRSPVLSDCKGTSRVAFHDGASAEIKGPFEAPGADPGRRAAAADATI